MKNLLQKKDKSKIRLLDSQLTNSMLNVHYNYINNYPGETKTMVDHGYHGILLLTMNYHGQPCFFHGLTSQLPWT